MNKKIRKIGFFQPQLVYPRGAERQICELASEFASDGFEVHLFCFSKNESYQYDYLLKNVFVHSLNVKYDPIYVGVNNIVFRFFFFYYIQIKNIIYTLLISKEIEKHTLDILNVHNYPGNWLSFFLKTPIIWTCNEPPYWVAYNVSILYKLCFSPMIFLDRVLSKNVKQVLVLNRQIKDLVDIEYATNSLVIGSGANIIRKIKHTENEFIDILIVGELHEKKRPTDLLNALSMLPEKMRSKYVVHFVGDGILKNDLTEFSRVNSISVKFYGRASNDALYKLFDIADASVFCAEKEPWGIFPLESLIAGIPLICSNDVGFLDILDEKHRKSVLTYEVGNIHDLSYQIKYLFDNLQMLRKNSERKKTTISDKTSWKKLKDKYSEIFNKIVVSSE